MAIGQVLRRLPGIEGKLQHLHTGQSRILPKLQNLRGQKPQILRYEGNLRQGLLDGADEVQPRALFPFSVLGGFVPIGHGPVAFKAPEMVQPHPVIEPSGGREPANPPAVTVLLVPLPAVQGVSPELSVIGKGIRGAACHRCGGQALIQLEQLRIAPHLTGVQGHINGHISQNLDTLLLGVLPQGVPLAVELVLDKLVKIHFFPKALANLPQCFRLPVFQGFLPLIPGKAAGFVLQGPIQGVISQPVGVFPAESQVVLCGLEAGAGQGQHLPPGLVQKPEVRPARVLPPGKALRLPRLQKPLRLEGGQVNQIFIAGKSGTGLVGRIPVACGVQGKNLPEALPRRSQKIYKIIGSLAHGTQSIRPGQAGNVHQNTTFTQYKSSLSEGVRHSHPNIVYEPPGVRVPG